jgi:ATP/maltotriose-dependent transcriptional regulator MalT
VVVIEAEAGMGKSSLIRTFVAGLSNVLLWEATGDESESSLQYGLMSQLTRLMDEELVRRLPILASGPASTVDPFAVGAELVQSLGGAQGDKSVLVLVLDDMHWADARSNRALLFTLRRLRHDPVLVIVSMRPEASWRLGESWHRFIHDPSRVRLIRPDGLQISEIKELAGALGLDDLGTPAAERLRRHTDGHPLYVRALLEELPREALIGSSASLPAPRSLAMTVLSRLGGLSRPAQRLVRSAAVLGQRCPLRLVVALAELSDGDDVGALQQAMEARLLERRNSVTTEEVAFAHPLLRAAVYNDLPPTVRRELHRQAAQLLSGAAAVSHRVAATAAYDDELAFELEDMAQNEAIREEASPAIDHYLMAAELSSTTAERESRLLRAFQVMLDVGEDARAKRLQNLIESCADGPIKSYVLGSLAAVSGHLIEAVPHLEAAVVTDAISSENSVRGRAALALAVVHVYMGDGLVARRWAQEALDHAGVDPAVGVFARETLAVSEAIMGNFHAALAVLNPPSTSVAKPPAFEANLMRERGMVRLWANDLWGASEDILTALRWSKSGSTVYSLPGTQGNLADIQYRIGLWDEALVHAELAVSLAHDMDRTLDLAMVHAVASYVHAGRGSFDVATKHAKQASEYAVVVPTPGNAIFASLAAATLARSRRKYQEVLEALDPLEQGEVRRFVEQLRPEPPLMLRAEALIELGMWREAESALTLLERLADQRFAATQLDALRLRGSFEACLGHHESAEKAFAKARSVAESNQLPFKGALLDIAQGRAMRHARDRRGAISMLQSARRQLASMGARPYVDECDAELGQCGLSGRGRFGTKDSRALTPKEQSVAHLVASGLSNSQAAEELYVTTKTVEFHLGNVFSKLGIDSRRELRDALARQGA